MKLRYWLIECVRDSHAYDIRERTKKAAIAKYVQEYGTGYSGDLQRITLKYDDAFDLLDSVLGESSWQTLSIDRKVYDITKMKIWD